MMGRVADLDWTRETGRSMVLIGYMAWAFGALMGFFLPGAIREGHRTGSLLILAALAVTGLVLVMIGRRLRGKYS